MADERFQVVIGATDQASPVLQKFKNELSGVQKQSKGAAAGLQVLADKAKWAFAGMSAAVMGATKVYADFENAMAKVATQLPGQMMEHFDEMTDAVQEMSIEFGQSTDVMAQGLYDILSAAIPPENALQLLEQSAKTAAAGFTDVATTSDLLTSILNAYGREVEDVAQISDVLFQSVFRGKMEFEEMAHELGSIMGVAAQAGVSLEDLGAAMATLTRAGIPTAEAATAIRGAIMSFIDPGKEALETAQALGIEFNSTALKSQGLIKAIGQLTGATQEQLSALFPNVRALVAVQGVLGDLDGAYEDLRLNMEAAGTTQEAFTKATGTLQFSLAQLKADIQTLVQDFGKALAPAIYEIIDAIRGFVERLKEIDEDTLKNWADLFVLLTEITGLVAGLNAVAKVITSVGTAAGLSMAVISPWILAIEGIAAAIVAVLHYKEEILSFVDELEKLLKFQEIQDFFTQLGEKLGIANESVNEYWGEWARQSEQAQDLSKDIEKVASEVEKLKEQLQSLDKESELYSETASQLEELTAKFEKLKNQYEKIVGVEWIPPVEETKELTKAQEKENNILQQLNTELPKLGEGYSESAKKAQELETALQKLSDISYETEWGISLVSADDVTSQVLSIQKQYEDTMKEIEGIVAEFPELADEADKAILLLSTKTSLDIENVYKEARNRLKEMTSEAEFAADLIGMDEYEKQLAQLEKELNTKLADIAKYPPQLAKEAQQATLAVWKEYLASIGEISLQRAEDEKKRIEEETKAEEEKIDEIIKLEREKNDKITQLNNEILKSTGRNLEALVQEHRTKYAEIVNLFDWTNDELKEIQAIAITDLTQQVTDYADSYISEMIRTGASSEEITNAIEGIVFVLEKVGVSSEVIAQLRKHFEELTPTVNDSKIAVEDLLDVISNIGDVVIGVQFGEKPTAGQIGGIFGGILGLFSGIPTWISGLVDMVFGWIDQIQQRTQEMIDSITGQFQSAMVDFFMEPDLDTAMENFGQRLNEIVYRMMVDAIVAALIASEVVQDAAKKLGEAITEYVKTGELEGLKAGIEEYIATWQDYVIPVMVEIYPQIQQYNPYESTAPARKTFSGTIPEYQTGGYVPYTGLALLHAGEYVIPKNETNTIAFGDIEINVNTTGGVDGADLWDEFEREARRRGVVLA